jgi:hypothetical protein
MALVDRVHVLLAVDRHRESAADPHVVERRPVLGQGEPERGNRGGERLDDGRGIRLADDLHLGRALQREEVALARAERRRTGRGIRRREDDVFVDVGATGVEVVGVTLENDSHLPRVFLEDVRSGTDHALLEISVLLEDLARKDHSDGLCDVLREQCIGRFEVDTQ